MPIIKDDYLTEEEEDLQHRIWRKLGEGKVEDDEDKMLFIDEVERGTYPKKCVKCYNAGARWCGYWEKNYICEEIEEGEAVTLAMKFYKRENS